MMRGERLAEWVIPDGSREGSVNRVVIYTL
jgi:hypothetical protein